MDAKGDSDDESETSISSVHTSDLSSFDDEISLSSDNENGEKKTIPLKEALKKYSVTDHKLSRDHIKLEVKSVNPKAPIRIVKKVVPKTKTGSSFSSKQSSAAPAKTIQKTIIVKKGVHSLKSQTSQHTIDPSKTSEKIAIKVVKNVAKPKPPIPEKKVVKKNSDGIKTRKNKSGGMRKVTVKPNEKKETSSSSKTPIRIVKKVVPKTKTGSSFSSKQSSAAPTKTIQKTIIVKKGVPSLITLSSNSEDESYEIHPDDGRMPIHSGPSTHNQTESPVPAKKKLVGPVSLEDYTGDNIKNSLLNAVQLIESWLPVSEVENSNELIGMFLFRQIISPNDTNHHCLLCTSKNTFRYLLDLEKHYCIVHELASQSSKAEISKNIIFVSKAPDVTEQTSLNSECRYCDIKLKNIEEVRSHYFTIHNRVVRVVPEQQVTELSSSIFCSICSEMSKNFTEHHTHMKNVHQYQIYMCKYCNFIASQSNRLKTHIKQKHPQATSPQPSTVVEKGSKVKLKCPVCWLFINGKEHLDQHVLLAHAVQTGSEIGCPKCLQPCGTSKDFIVHVFSCVAPKIDDQSQKSDGHYEKKASFLKNSRERYREKERASKYLEKDKFTSNAPKRKNSVGSSSSSEFSDSN